MQTMRRPGVLFVAVPLVALAAAAAAQDANITQPVADLERLFAAEPLEIKQSKISRPNAKGDITLRAEISFGGAQPLWVKLRKSEPGADSFNNVPRYDVAAYELQKFFLDAAEYVVPPTALRMVPLADFPKDAVDVARTFAAADQVLAVVQYWLNDIQVPPDVFDAERFAKDGLYARHIGQLNVLTYLIRHGDSNMGNFIIGKAEVGARVFSVDHGVAFASEESDRGDAWRVLRVADLPADTVERLRGITLGELTERLGVLAQWRLEGRNYDPVALGENLSENRGVRREQDQLQMGLTKSEIRAVHRRLEDLLEQVDKGKIRLVAAPSQS
jgi:hypothetical protein